MKPTVIPDDFSWSSAQLHPPPHPSARSVAIFGWSKRESCFRRQAKHAEGAWGQQDDGKERRSCVTRCDIRMEGRRRKMCPKVVHSTWKEKCAKMVFCCLTLHRIRMDKMRKWFCSLFLSLTRVYWIPVRVFVEWFWCMCFTEKRAVSWGKWGMEQHKDG